MSNPLPSDGEPPSGKNVAAFCVHILTAGGAAAGLMALLEASRGRFAAMFGWLGFALLIDGLDGPLARRFAVVRRLPNWSGEVLDLVVDFVTYVFVPAYAIAASGLLIPFTEAPLAAAVIITSALYFADRRMKTDDNHFRGFPALWNAIAFYLFLLRPPPVVATLLVAVFAVLTFVPIRVVHPLRVERWRRLNVGLTFSWGLLALYVVLSDFQVSAPVSWALCAIGLYMLCADTVIRLIRRGFS